MAVLAGLAKVLDRGCQRVEPLVGGIGSRRQQGYIQGVASSSGSLASIVGLTAGGVLYTVAGTLTFAIAAALFVLVFLLSIPLGGQHGGIRDAAVE